MTSLRQLKHWPLERFLSAAYGKPPPLVANAGLSYTPKHRMCYRKKAAAILENGRCLTAYSSYLGDREMHDTQLNFLDTCVAFAGKTDAELKKQYVLFRLLGNSFLTSILSTLAKGCLKIRLPIELLIRWTIFKQFCGGETFENCLEIVESLSNHHIKSILDYSAEDESEEEKIEIVKEEILHSIRQAADNNHISFAVFKVTGVVRNLLLEKISASQTLSLDEQAEWQRAKQRVEAICTYAHSAGKPIFFDAEESWIQDGIDLLAIEMMERFNRKKPVIFNTIQLYRRDRLEFLKKSHIKAKESNYIFAAKLVRGAYLEKERERAIKLRYPSPIQPDKNATDKAYNEALIYCIENIDSLAFCVGSHNSESIQLLSQIMSQKGIISNHSSIHFAQLYGMGDNLSYILSKNNYNVSKLVPYGSIKSVLPYLIRRAKENTSMLGQMSRELELISIEMQRRKLNPTRLK